MKMRFLLFLWFLFACSHSLVKSEQSEVKSESTDKGTVFEKREGGAVARDDVEVTVTPQPPVVIGGKVYRVKPIVKKHKWTYSKAPVVASKQENKDKAAGTDEKKKGDLKEETKPPSLFSIGWKIALGLALLAALAWGVFKRAAKSQLGG